MTEHSKGLRLILKYPAKCAIAEHICKTYLRRAGSVSCAVTPLIKKHHVIRKRIGFFNAFRI